MVSTSVCFLLNAKILSENIFTYVLMDRKKVTQIFKN